MEVIGPCVFGPHCWHDQCSMFVCDLESDPTSGVLFNCHAAADCPYCGPTSGEWTRLSTAWIEWCIGRYGTADGAELRAIIAMPANVVAMAELVEANPAGKAENNRVD